MRRFLPAALSLAILSPAIADPRLHPEDQTGISYEFGIGPDGNNYEFHIETINGMGYQLWSSRDLVNWQSEALHRGTGQNFRFPLFAAPQGGLDPGDSGEAPEEYIEPVNVGIRYSRLVDGSGNDIGFHFKWVSLEDDTTVKNYTVYGQTLHEFFPPIYVQIHGNFFYSMGLFGERTQVEPNDILSGKDAAMVSTWLDHLDQINADAAAQQQVVLNHVPVPPDPNGKQFFRLMPVVLDSDGDGWADHLETGYGTDPYDTDTDGDGIDDPYDASPLVNNAVADPDGAGLSAALNSDLLARWDFEPTNGQTGLEDKSGNSRDLSLMGQTAQQSYTPTGMVSYASKLQTGHMRAQAGFLKQTSPSYSSNLRSNMTVSFWMKIDEGAISGSTAPMGVWNTGLSRYYNIQDSQGYWRAFSDTRVYGLNVKKNINGDELWAVGAYTARNNHDGNHSTWLYYDPFAANPVTGAYDGNEVKWIMPAGSSDTGEWRHVVLVRQSGSVGSFPNGRTAVYMDGQLVAESALKAWALDNSSEWYQPDTGVFVGQLASLVSGAAVNSAQFKGNFDRMRIYSKSLSASQVLELYHQDIDVDGLWDVSEVKSLLWRDHNGDGIRTHDEDRYTANPFYNDPVWVDHDDDGLVSLDEQNIYGTSIAHPDTDKDQMPDGWEVTYNLDPLNPADANLDVDSDGLTNLKEYSYASNPNNPDTDGDNTSDGAEIAQGSIPSDGYDNGQPVPDEEKLSILLGVGDESGSDSENYVMHVYELDPDTNLERRIYTLNSGGYGQYKEETKSFFRKKGTYTFQIDWIASNLEASSDANNPDGADFDYTFKVQPQDEEAELTIIDSVDPILGQTEAEPKVLGQQGDMVQFKSIQEKKRVMRVPIDLDVSLDSDMDGQLEALTNDRKNNIGRDQKSTPPFGPDRTSARAFDDEYLEQDADDNPYLMGAIIDVNNNNSDSGKGRPTSGAVDNSNNVLDGTEDLNELMAGVSTPGHNFGKMQIVLRYSRRLDPQYEPDNPYRLKISFSDEPGQLVSPDQVVRVFDHGDYDQDNGKPAMLLGPELTSAYIDLKKFYTDKQRERATGAFDKEISTDLRKVFQKQLFVVEGLTAGYAVIEVALVKLEQDGSETVLHKDFTSVVVNVDRAAQPASEVAGNLDAVGLRGVAPHYTGFRKAMVDSVGTPANIRAIRGTMIVRPPSIKTNSGWRTMNTWMLNNPLRQPLRGNDRDAGSSFWIGLRKGQLDGSGDTTWVQCGVRWRQKEEADKGSVPFAYIETGTRVNSVSLLAPIIRNNAAKEATNPDDAGQGVLLTGVDAMDNWEDEPLILEFILYKTPGAENRESGGTEDATEASDVSLNHWRVWFRDARAGKDVNIASNYFGLKANWPAPNKTIGATNRDKYRDAYKAQGMHLLEAQFETSQSISFAPGNSNAPAQILNLQEASGLINGVDPSDRPNNEYAKDNFLWAAASFNWSNVQISDSELNRQYRTGKAGNGNVPEETIVHEWWRSQLVPGGIKIWDTRDRGFKYDPANWKNQ